MNYLISGGAGFIGSHLVERLLREDNKITVVDGHSNKIIVIDDFSEGKYANLPKDPRLTVYDANILGDIGHLFEGIDIVFHLAALTRPQWSMLYPFDTDRVNTGGTIKVLEHSRDHKVKRVVFMSSSSLYGENVYPTPEDAVPNPMCPYALTKLIGEQYCQIFQKLYGLEFNAVRPFNVYGARMNPKGIYSSAVAKFIEVIYKRLPLHITGSGEQARDFVYVDDAVDALMTVGSSQKAVGKIFNIGSNRDKDIYGIINDIVKLVNSGNNTQNKINVIKIDPINKTDIITNENADKTPLHFNISHENAETVLRWKPKYNLEKGLIEVIKEFKETKQNNENT